MQYFGMKVVQYNEYFVRTVVTEGLVLQHQRIGSHSVEYRKISNIRCTKSQNLNDLFLPLSLSNPLKSGVKSRMKMLLEQRRQAMLQLHLSDQQFYCLPRCSLYYRFDGMHTCISSCLLGHNLNLVVELILLMLILIYVL